MEPFFLPDRPNRLDIAPDALARLTRLYESDVLADSEARPEIILRDEFDLDVSARYGRLPIRHPFGKASGQLSLQVGQVESDIQNGLGFVVLKTVIAEDEAGAASMEAWKIREPRMVVERIEGFRAERTGWTVSWAGRGWEGSLQSYLDFTAAALGVSAGSGVPVIPSVKYHLPGSPEEPFREAEYGWTTRRLEEIWRAARGGGAGGDPGDAPLVLEQDFSPTLAGADLAGSKRMILNWLERCPALIKSAAPDCVLGIKLMNAMFDDEFQIEMMKSLTREGSACDFLICFNRLFDPQRAFGEKKGIAYGGPDLSDRNLATLRGAIARGVLPTSMPVSATGDIASGRMMVEYALRGATSGQIHTFFQLGPENFRLRGRGRTRAALHELFFHPAEGLAAAMLHLRSRLGGRGTPLKFLDLPALGREWIMSGAMETNTR